MMHVPYKLTALRLTSADRKYPPYVLAATVSNIISATVNKQKSSEIFMVIGLVAPSSDY